jgi:GT2 family glycosyltransferase
VRFTAEAPVAIIVPVHNRLAHTQRLLAQLRESDHAEALVVVVDDGSTDGTTEYLRAHEQDVVVIPGSGELWWSGAANAGCAHALEHGAQVLILFNNDNTAMSANCVAELARSVDETGGCVGSVVLFSGTNRVLNAGGNLVWPTRGLELRDAGARYDQEVRVVECDWLAGMSLAFPSELFTALSGFDADAFPQYYGDADFTLRAGQSGRSCVVSYSCWVSNDVKTSGLNFYARVSPKAFISGLFSRRSSYELRTTVRFARRWCPRHLLPLYLVLYYLRYAWATVKSWTPLRATATPS